MPIISNFPGGAGGAGGGLSLGAVKNIQTLTASGKVFVKWTDPDDLEVAGSKLAEWAGTLLIRKAGSKPVSRRDGVQILDSKVRHAYEKEYFCDDTVTNGVTYYYKFFPYTTANSYTDNEADEFSATPGSVPLGNVSGVSAQSAGNGKLNVKWTDPEPTVTQDGIVVATWANTTVVVKAGSYATSADDDSGDVAFRKVVTTRNEYQNTPLLVTGLRNGVTYYISFFPTTTDGSTTLNDANRTTGVPNRFVIETVPTQKGTLTYNKGAQNPEWNNYDPNKMTLNVVSQTNAGTYDATFTPTDDYCWSHGGSGDDIGPKTVQWAIGKKVGTLTTNVQTVTLDKDHLSAQFTIGGEHDGTLSIEVTAGGTYFSAQLAGTTVTVTSKDGATGEGTIVVKCTDGSNYSAPTNVTVSVKAQFMPAQGAALDTYTWEQISQVSEAGLGDTYWKVGDRKSVVLNGTVGTLALSSKTLYVYILGFNHNSDKEGKGIQFGTFKDAATNGNDVCLVDSKYNGSDTGGTKYFNMNHKGNANYGGWAACDLRYDVLGSTDQQPSVYNAAKTSGCKGYDASTATATKPVSGTLMAALPSDLRAVMKPIKKYTDNVGGGTDVTGNISASLDYLPLLSECEIFGGNRTYANQYEKNYQQQYAYYAASNAKIKKRHDNTGTAAIWWERSPYYYTGGSFCAVYTNGTANGNGAGYSYGLAPAFMV